MGGTEDDITDPGWKGEIKTCTAVDCPLYPHRPYRKDVSEDEEDNESE